MVTVFTDTQNLTCSFLKTLQIVELLLPHYKSVAQDLQGQQVHSRRGRKKNLTLCVPYPFTKEYSILK